MFAQKIVCSGETLRYRSGDLAVDDKLDLDARVSRLERKVTSLQLVLLAVATSAILAGLLLVVTAVRLWGYSKSVAATVVPTPPPSIEVGAMTKSASTGTSMAELAKQLDTLQSLYNRGVINNQECKAKKQRILEQPWTSTDLKSDLETAQGLYNRSVINNQEWNTLKAKILNIGQ
jgi:hypothetical protein